MKLPSPFLSSRSKQQLALAFFLFVATACEAQKTDLGINYSNHGSSQNALSEADDCENYDLLLRLKTEDDHESADSPGPFRFTFKHRDTLAF